MDFEAVAGHDHLFHDQAQDGLLHLIVRVREPGAELRHDGLGAGDLPGGQLPPRLPGAQFRPFLFDRDDPVLDGGLPGSKFL